MPGSSSPRDCGVQVRAVAVTHGRAVPAFAYRFDTADGSVVFSGDTTVNDDLIALAQGPTSWCTTWRTCRVGWRLRRHFGRDVEGRDDLSGRGRGNDRTLEGAVGLHDDLAGAVHVPPQVVVEHRGQAPSLEQFTVV